MSGRDQGEIVSLFASASLFSALGREELEALAEFAELALGSGAS